MRKICTVLLMNFLRSAKHPKVLLASSLAVVVILVTLAARQWGPQAATMATQHANAVINSATNANAANAAPAANAPAKQAKPRNASNASGGNTNSASSSSSSRAAADAARTADFTVKDISLDPTATTCNNGQPAYAVQAAHIGLTTSIHGGGTIRWRWETRVDGSDTTDSPPISNQTYSQNVTAGSLPVTLQSDDQANPLLTAPTSSNYSYSFRLHILGPNDVTSDWVSVPVVLDNSCQQQS
jgi:hypothetical protein